MMYQSPEEAVADSVGSIWGCYGYRDLVRKKSSWSQAVHSQWVSRSHIISGLDFKPTVEPELK